jgi:undecaprenyl-diphosphatase
MTSLEALFLATIQGLTEFLPISSSGHLVLFQKLFRFTTPPILFDVFLHFGTLVSIVVFFRREIFFLITHFRKEKEVWLALILGSIPAAFFGFLLSARLASLFNSLFLLAGSWILFGMILLVSRRFAASKGKAGLEKVGSSDSLVIGFFQALALLPGISRSGSTIIGGFSRGLSHETAFKFSFLLAIPAILGATLLELKMVGFEGINLLTDSLAMVVAGLVGYGALVFLQKILRSGKFHLFGFYCLAIGVLALLLAFGT